MMDRTELQSYIDEAIEEYKEDMEGDGYDYSDWSVDPQVRAQIFAFVEALPAHLPCPEPFIREGDLLVGWGYTNEIAFNISVHPEGGLWWTCGIYDESTDYFDGDGGVFEFSGNIPKKLISLIERVIENKDKKEA